MGHVTTALFMAAQPHLGGSQRTHSERHRRDLSSLTFASAAPETPEIIAIYQRQNRSIRVWTYPNDPALPSLAMTEDAGAGLGQLDWVGAWPGIASLERLAYKPGQRAIFLVRAANSQQRYVLRLLQPDGFRHSLQIARQLAGTHMASQLALPALVAYAPAAHALLFSYVPGMPLQQAEQANQTGRCSMLAELLANIHATHTMDVPIWDGAQELTRAELLLTDLSHWYPGEAASLWSVYHSIKTRLMATPDAATVLCHGDLSTRNLLLPSQATQQRPGVIDWDAASYGPPERDLASLIAGLRQAGSDSEQLIAAYEHATGRVVDRARLVAFMQYQRLLKLCRKLLRDDQLPPDGLERIMGALDGPQSHPVPTIMR